MASKFVKFCVNLKKIAISFARPKLKRFLMDLKLQNDPKINAFGSFVCKCRFHENHCFSLVKSMFFRFGLTKNRTKIECKTRSKKRWCKNRISSGFGVHF